MRKLVALSILNALLALGCNPTTPTNKPVSKPAGKPESSAPSKPEGKMDTQKPESTSPPAPIKEGKPGDKGQENK